MIIQDIIEKNGETIMVSSSNGIDFFHTAFVVLYIVGIFISLIFFYFLFYIVYKLYKRAKHW